MVQIRERSSEIGANARATSSETATVAALHLIKSCNFCDCAGALGWPGFECWEVCTTVTAGMELASKYSVANHANARMLKLVRTSTTWASASTSQSVWMLPCSMTTVFT